VIIPDTPPDLASLDNTAAAFRAAGRTVRWDPILEPIGFGFATSLARYYQVREKHPDAAMMMGIGNVTELSEVDSAGVNFLLAALCEELRIGSILTTSVISWCQTAVQEFDIARRLVRHAIHHRTLPKHLHGDLVMLRDPRVFALGEKGIAELRQRITDPNFRIFAERGEVHLLNRYGYWHGSDPYEVFDRMVATVGTLTAEHAFYLGMELMKARTALTLGKQYMQDESLRWGFLTVEEQSAIARRRNHGARPDNEKT
jgi:dihydropteroate synthase-like protein